MSKIGVNNGNWRGAEMREYMRDVQSGEVVGGPAPLCKCGNKIENPWYGATMCYSCQREMQATFDDVIDDMRETTNALCNAVLAVYDEPQYSELVSNAYMEPLDWPWTRQDWLDELDNRRPETCL